MSLINDALKRASQVKPSDPMADVDAAPLHPVQEATSRTWVLYTVGIMMAALLASWAIVIGIWANRETKVSTRDTQAMVVAQAAQPAQKSEPAEPIATKIEKPVELAAVATVPAPPAASVENEIPPPPIVMPAAESAAMSVPLGYAVTEPPKPSAPTFRLQGIFYREANPTAMINTKMVRPGDKLLNAKVVSIERERVTLERDGEMLILELQMQ